MKNNIKKYENFIAENSIAIAANNGKLYLIKTEHGDVRGVYSDINSFIDDIKKEIADSYQLNEIEISELRVEIDSSEIVINYDDDGLYLYEVYSYKLIMLNTILPSF